MKNSQKGFVLPLLITITALLVVGGGAYVYLNKEAPEALNQINNNFSTTTDVIPNNKTTPQIQLTDEDRVIHSENRLVDNFLKNNNSISISNIDFIKKITQYNGRVNAFKKNYAEISYIKIDNNFYFADERESATGNVYSLNITNNQLKTIYTTPPSNYYFHLIGVQGSKLLFEKIDQMDSPGPCYDSWLYAYENPLPRPKSKYPNQEDSRTIKSLDLNNPGYGFSDIVPKISKDYYISAAKCTVQ